jgi:hypothetical protein
MREKSGVEKPRSLNMVALMCMSHLLFVWLFTPRLSHREYIGGYLIWTRLNIV